MGAAVRVGTLIGMFAIPAFAQSVWKPDALFGIWSLQGGAQSHYADASLPEQMTLIIEPAPEGLAYCSETHFAGGRIVSSQFVARFDGTPALVVGMKGFLAPVRLAPSGDAAIDAVYTSGIQKVAWSHWSVSADGSQLLVTTSYLDSKGDEQKNVATFRRMGTQS